MTTHLHSSRQRLAYIAGSTLLGLLFLSVLAINLVPFFDGKNDLMDFGSFYASGMKLTQGGNPYDPNSDFIFDIVFPKVGAGGKMMNLNPPISALLFAPLTRFEPHRLLIVWQVVSFLLYALCMWLLAQTYKDQLSVLKVIWPFLLAGFWHTIVLGQIYIVLLLFTVLGWMFLQQKKYVLAGVAIGLLIAMKPNFVLWPLFLLISGYTVASAVSVGTALLVSSVPWLFYGSTIYAQWLEASKLQAATLIMPGNNSILGLWTRFGSIPFGLTLSILIVLALLALARLRTSASLDRPAYVSALGILASLLASPIAWTGYTILLAPIFFALKKWTVPTLVAAVILAIPFQLVLLFFQNSFTNFVLFGWLYGWGILALLAGVVMNTMRMSSIHTN